MKNISGNQVGKNNIFKKYIKNRINKIRSETIRQILGIHSSTENYNSIYEIKIIWLHKDLDSEKITRNVGTLGKFRFRWSQEYIAL